MLRYGRMSARSPSVAVVPAPAIATAPPPVRDFQRARVYRAENSWADRLDAARRGAPLASVGGSELLLPGERRFGTLDAAAAWCAAVLKLPAVQAIAGALPSPEIRPRAGPKAAHWEPPATIAVPVPPQGEPWALRESVLLHELAHHVGHLTGLADSHAPPFPALVLLMTEQVLGEQAAFALRVDYGRERVVVGAL